MSESLRPSGNPISWVKRKTCEQKEQEYLKSSPAYAMKKYAESSEGKARMEQYRREERKKAEKEAAKPKPDPALKYYRPVFRPGSLMITSGRRGGGKTHAAVSFAQMLVEERCPELGKWRLATNIIFVRKARGEYVTDYPEGVHHITTMKELFPIAADVLEKGENLLLILDEAQNFLLGEHNGTSTVTSMKTFMGIIRKFNITVWLLSPATRNMGPSFRNFIDDDDNPGNVNAVWSKDQARANAFIKKHDYKVDPRDVIFMKDSAHYPDVALRIPQTSWTTPPEKLKEGEFCYDHKASAEFSVGDNFDFKAFISATGNISSFGMVKAIREFYANQEESDDGSEKSSEEILIAAASRIKSMGLTDESISRAFDIPATTLRRKSEQYGLPWSSDKSNNNPDRYVRFKVNGKKD